MRIGNELHLRTRRAVLAAGGAALVGCATLGVVALGVANAQSVPTPGVVLSTAGNGNATFVSLDSAQLKEKQDKFVSTLAAKLGVTSDKLQQALKDTEQEVGPVPLLLGGPGKAALGVQGTAISITGDLSTAAKVIGISEDQLRQELTGKSLTDVAKAHNVDPQKVANALKSARAVDLDQAVQSGKLPADAANAIKSHLDQEIDMLMNMLRSGDAGFSEAGGPGIRIMFKSAPGD
jgi:hypothetical protein